MPTDVETNARDTGHSVQFYDRDEALAGTVARFLAPAIDGSDAALMVATPAHRAAFEAALTGRGLDLRTARAAGAYVALDAASVLDRFMVDGGPDAHRFADVIGGLVAELAAGGRRVRVYGEMVALLWDAGNVVAAIALESLWNDLGRSHSFSLLCGYPTAAFGGEVDGALYEDVCSLHSAVATPPAEVFAVFEPGSDAVRAARRFVVDAIGKWRVPGLAAEAAIVVSELATNAVLHAHSPFDVTVSTLDGVVTIAVADTSPRQPVRRTFGDQARTGRGLRLVAAVSRRWGTDPRPGGGKVVWAELVGPPASPLPARRFEAEA